MSFHSPATDELRLVLRPIPGVAWINQQQAYGYSEVSFAEEAAKLLRSEASDGPITVTRVMVNGREVAYRLLTPTSMQVRPALRLEGEYLVIVCELPFKPTRRPLISSPPACGYGLQRPATLPMKHAQ